MSDPAHALIQLENQWLMIQADGIAKRGMDLLSTLPPRTLHFPVDHSLGWLFVHAPGEYDLNSREQAIPAQGAVNIPAGKQVGLDVTQADLAPLRDLQPHDLDLLSLAAQPIDDTALAHIAHLNLRKLVLEHTPITNAGSVHIAVLTELAVLLLAHTRIGDPGIAQLASIPNLQVLDLSHTAITDAGMAHLGRLSNLQTLLLADTRISDQGLTHLQTLTRLTTLDLSRTAISDAGLNLLKPLALLQDLGLANTAITAIGWEKLRGNLPRCTIIR